MERIVFAQLSSIIEMNLLTRMMSMFASRGLKIGSITRTSGGEYSGTPAVSFTGGGGTGATATAFMAVNNVYSPVTSITGSMSGYYTLASATPTVTITGTNGGSGATATATMSSGFIGNGYSSINQTAGVRSTNSSGSITFSGGGGSGAAATYNSIGHPARMTINTGAGRIFVGNPGSGYTSPPTVTFGPNASGLGTQVTYPTATATISGGQVTAINVDTSGEFINSQMYELYTPPSITLSGGGGSGATAFWSGGGSAFNVLDYWVGGVNGSYTVTNPGSGYTSNLTASVAGQVTGTFLITPVRNITGITVTNGGSLYYGATVSISGGTPDPYSTITHNWTVNGNWYTYNYVNALTVTNSGSGYTSAPTVVFSGGGVTSHATATANMIPE